MPRPCCLRHVAHRPDAVYFKPAGVPTRSLEVVILTLDEMEALRLADLNGLYQEQAAAEMKISRATFARIVESGRRKVADALTGGKALRLEGGSVALSPKKAPDTAEPGAGRVSHCSCCPPAGGRHAQDCTYKEHHCTRKG